MYDYIIAQKDLIVILSSISSLSLAFHLISLISRNISSFVYHLFFLSPSHSSSTKLSINHPTMKISSLSKPSHITIFFKKESQDQNQNFRDQDQAPQSDRSSQPHPYLYSYVYNNPPPPNIPPESKVQAVIYCIIHQCKRMTKKKFLPPRI